MTQLQDQPLDYHNDFLLKTISQLRFRLEAHHISRFYLEIAASGETDDTGSTLLEFRLGKDRYSDTVRGNSLHPVIDEFVRRHGWQEKNDSKLLPNYSRGDLQIDEEHFSEEVPF